VGFQVPTEIKENQEKVHGKEEAVSQESVDNDDPLIQDEIITTELEIDDIPLPKLVEDTESTAEIEDIDELLKQVPSGEVKAELPPKPVVEKVQPEVSAKIFSSEEGYEGRECDIVFDESHFNAVSMLPIEFHQFDYSDYNDPFSDGKSS
jgi:hypothetical protein